MNKLLTGPLLPGLLLSGLLGAAALSGCNTVEGLGEDIEAAGDTIEDEANEHR